MTDFRDLVGDDLTPEEEARLQRVHELLVAAGPPPELPPVLQKLPAAPRSKLFNLPRRRLGAKLVFAAGLAAVVFGVGFLLGNRGQSFYTEHRVAMHPTAAAPRGVRASIDVGDMDKAGNWPLRLRVLRLPQQPPGKYYELWLTRNGKPVATCGTFRVRASDTATVVRLNAPYKLKAFDGWIVTTDHKDEVLLTTASLAWEGLAERRSSSGRDARSEARTQGVPIADRYRRH